MESKYKESVAPSPKRKNSAYKTYRYKIHGLTKPITCTLIEFLGKAHLEFDIVSTTLEIHLVHP
jgi:hypothetical protein